MCSRRGFLQSMLAVTGVAAAERTAAARQHLHPPDQTAAPLPSDTVRRARLLPPPREIVPVEAPDLPKLRWTDEDGVKVFHLVAEPVKRAFLPGRTFDVWGFNGSMPGPTVEVNEGDRVRFIVENRLPEIFSMHWHGLEVPIEMDGVPGISQDPIPPGGRFVYEFTLHQHGTFFYHSHMPMQEMLGLIGLFIIHPERPYEPRVHRDFGLIFQGWAILPNNSIPNTLAMEFNWLTINGRSGPATTPMIVRLGERVRIRMVNLGMDHHPIHLHGNTFYTVGTEAGRIPRASWEPGNTVLVGVAQARDVEFDAIYEGDWMLHCHLPHHMMNHMVSMVGPMAHAGHGVPTGMGMEEGMGVIRQGHALSRELGPSLGRTLGAGDHDRAVTNLPLGTMAQQDHGQHEHAQPDARDVAPPGAPNEGMVPGFPQDMWMVMDEQVEKPETFGMRPTWTAGMMGMMTVVRVVRPELFDRILALNAARGEEVAP